MSSSTFRKALIAGLASAGLAALAVPAIMAGPPDDPDQRRVIVIADKGDREEEGGGYLGVSVQTLGRRLREALEIPSDVEGLLVSHVGGESPAEEAGIRERDVITRFNGRNVEDLGSFTAAVRAIEPGSRVTVTVWRDGRVRDLEATLEGAPLERMLRMLAPDAGDDESPARRKMIRKWIQRDDDDAEAPEAPRPPRPPRALDLRDLPDMPDVPDMSELRRHIRELKSRGWLGVQMQPLNEEIAGFFGAPNAEGVLIWKVEEESPALEAGLKAGDVIVEVEGKAITEPQDLSAAIAGHDPGDNVAITYLRRGVRETVKVELDKSRNPNLLFFGDMPEMALPRTERRQPGARPFERLQREMDELRQKLDKLGREMEQLRD